MISLATKYPNVYINTSGYKASRYPRELVGYPRGHGRRKVLFGSSHPAWPAADCLASGTPYGSRSTVVVIGVVAEWPEMGHGYAAAFDPRPRSVSVPF